MIICQREVLMTYLTAIFWFYGDEIILFKKEVEPDYMGMAIYPENHVDKWREVIKDRPEIAGKKYNDIPRGRMTYFAGTRNVYNIAVGKTTLENKALMNALLAKLELPAGANIVFGETAYY